MPPLCIGSKPCKPSASYVHVGSSAKVGPTAREPESGGTCDDGGAEVVEGVSGWADGKGVEEGAGGLGASPDLLARLIDAAVPT